jgi:hypothetical protein
LGSLATPSEDSTSVLFSIKFELFTELEELIYSAFGRLHLVDLRVHAAPLGLLLVPLHSPSDLQVPVRLPYHIIFTQSDNKKGDNLA